VGFFVALTVSPAAPPPAKSLVLIGFEKPPAGRPEPHRRGGTQVRTKTYNPRKKLALSTGNS
jgi:hypothetical protein